MVKIIFIITLILFITGMPLDFFIHNLSIKKRLLILVIFILVLVISGYFGLQEIMQSGGDT